MGQTTIHVEMNVVEAKRDVAAMIKELEVQTDICKEGEAARSPWFLYLSYHHAIFQQYLPRTAMFQAGEFHQIV